MAAAKKGAKKGAKKSGSPVKKTAAPSKRPARSPAPPPKRTAAARAPREGQPGARAAAGSDPNTRPRSPGNQDQKRPAKKRASTSDPKTKTPKKLTPAQKGAITRAKNKAAKEAAHEKHVEAGKKGAATKAKTKALLEKAADPARVLTKAERRFLEKRADKTRSDALEAKLNETVDEQEQRIGSTQLIKEHLFDARREAIDNKVGWYPSRLRDSVFTKFKTKTGRVIDDKLGPGRTWIESQKRIISDDTAGVHEAEFLYFRSHHRSGVILGMGRDYEDAAKDLEDRIAMHYKELDSAAHEKSPHVRGFVQLYAYAMMSEKDTPIGKSRAEALAKRYAQYVRLVSRGRSHHIDRNQDPKSKAKKICREVLMEEFCLVGMPASSGMFPDIENVMDGVHNVIEGWRFATDYPIIVDSYFISIEARPIPSPKDTVDKKTGNRRSRRERLPSK